VAGRRVPALLAHHAIGAEKKLIAAITDSVTGDGGTPWELLEWDIVRETGWTFEELDRQDSARVITMLRASNIRSALQRVMGFMNLSAQQIKAVADSGQIPIDPEDMKIWGEAMAIRDEVKKLNG
jgi:hypothetical protein